MPPVCYRKAKVLLRNDERCSTPPGQAAGAKQRLPHVPGEWPVYPFLTGGQLLEFVAAVRQSRLATSVSELVEQFGLTPYLDVRFDAISLGIQKKFLLSATWIGDPSAMVVGALVRKTISAE